MWSRRWLGDEDIRSMRRLTRLAFIELLALANECFDCGKFTINRKMSMTKKTIIDQAYIKEKELDELIELGKVSEKDGLYWIAGWDKYHSDSERVMENRNLVTPVSTE